MVKRMRNSVRRRAATVPALALVVACFAGQLAFARGQSAGPCRANDSGAAESLAYLKKVVSAMGDEMAVVRDSLGISVFPDTAVALIQDDSVCQLAVTAFEADVADSAQAGRQVYVFRVSNQFFVVEDPDERAGEWSIFAFYTPSWVHHKNLFW